MLTICITGGSGSGKSTLVRNICQLLAPNSVCLFPMDAYYKDQGHLTAEEKAVYNFDHPDAIDFDLMIEHLQFLKLYTPVQRPVYSFVDCCRLSQIMDVIPREIVLVDGLLALSNQRLSEEFDLSIFLEVRDDIRLQRVIQRDLVERGREPEVVIERFYRQVKPMHDLFIEPVKQYADLIIEGSESFPDEIAQLAMGYIFNYLYTDSPKSDSYLSSKAHI